MKFIPIKCDCGGEFNAEFTTRFGGRIWPPIDSVFVGKEGHIENNQFMKCNNCEKIITSENIAEFMKDYFENENNIS